MCQSNPDGRSRVHISVCPRPSWLTILDCEDLSAMDYWFPAKRSGLGWGPPTKWQGWVFLVLWIGLLIAGTRSLGRLNLSSVIFFGGMIAVVILVIVFKGEPRKL